VKPLIEVLTFDGCPHAAATRELIGRVAAELEAQADVVVVDVPDQAAAATHRFLGSPTVRVDGRDMDVCPNPTLVMNLRRGDLPRGRVGETGREYVRTPARSSSFTLGGVQALTVLPGATTSLRERVQTSANTVCVSRLKSLQRCENE